MQQVNLYTPELRPVQVLLPARQIGLILGVLLILLVALQASLYWQGHQSKAGLADAETRLGELQQRYEQLESAVSQLRTDGALQAENERLAGRLDSTRYLLGSLQPDGSAAMAEKFSTLFEGLARQRQEGLWLTDINVREAGQLLELRGTVTRAELLPMYLQKLRDESAFAGRRFNVLQLQAPEDRKRQLSFYISTHDGKPGSARTEVVR